jgi:hypothetical protein
MQDGPQGMRESSWQFDAWGLAHDDVRAISSQLLAALSTDDTSVGFYCLVDNIQYDYEAETERYRCCLSVRLWFRGE